MNRKQATAWVLGVLEGEGFSHSKATHVLGLNPSLIEEAMQCKTEQQLKQLAEETIRKLKAYQQGYSEGMKKGPILPHEKKELERRLRLIKGGCGSVHDLQSQKLELRARVARLVGEGYKLDSDTEKEIEELTEDV